MFSSEQSEIRIYRSPLLPKINPGATKIFVLSKTKCNNAFVFESTYLSKQTLMTTPTKRLQRYRRKSIPDPDRNLILKHLKKSSTKEYCKVDSTNNIKNILAHQFISIKAQFHSVFSYLCQYIELTILIMHRCSSNSFVYSID